MNDTTRRQGRRMILRGSAMVMALGAAGCGTGGVGPNAVAGRTPDARVEMRQVQAAYVASGGGGSGTLHYRGRDYPFTIAAGGIGGIGASTLEAEGDVFNLRDPRDFAGAYGQARYGGAVGTASAGELWLENAAGVIMRLRARRTGLMLSLGGDAVVISMSP
ncbi:hypothetical protein [Falsiroseomonas bella]|nr:hypothetical protein [Falsiroseomonas bella]